VAHEDSREWLLPPTRTHGGSQPVRREALAQEHVTRSDLVTGVIDRRQMHAARVAETCDPPLPSSTAEYEE
jgi:hypothetical protein